MNTKMNMFSKATKSEVSTLEKDLNRHLCSLAVIAYRYQRHLPHLVSPGLANLRDEIGCFTSQLRKDLAVLARRIVEIGGTPLTRVEQVERRSYLPLLLGEQFRLREAVGKDLKAEKRLQAMLSHTVRRARKAGDETTADAVTDVLSRSAQRERVLNRLALSL